MNMDEALNQVEVRSLRARAVLFEADAIADAIEQKHRRNVPLQQGFSAPESSTVAMFFWDFGPASHRLFSRSFAAIPAQAPLSYPVHSSHTSCFGTTVNFCRISSGLVLLKSRGRGVEKRYAHTTKCLTC